MPTLSSAPAPVNTEHLPTLEEMRRAQARLSALVDRLYAAIARQQAIALQDAPLVDQLRAAVLAAAAPKRSLMPVYESPERECDTCGMVALCDYADPFDTNNPDVICGACEATIRNRPYAPLTEEVS